MDTPLVYKHLVVIARHIEDTNSFMRVLVDMSDYTITIVRYPLYQDTIYIIFTL